MLHERLRDGDASFGLTQAQYASREKARLRAREKKRRQRAMEAARALVVVEQRDDFTDGRTVYRRPDGMLVYVAGVQMAPNPRGTWLPQVAHPITLPLLSIQCRAA